jgi:hypothetical protein
VVLELRLGAEGGRRLRVEREVQGRGLVGGRGEGLGLVPKVEFGRSGPFLEVLSKDVVLGRREGGGSVGPDPRGSSLQVGHLVLTRVGALPRGEGRKGRAEPPAGALHGVGAGV